MLRYFFILSLNLFVILFSAQSQDNIILPEGVKQGKTIEGITEFFFPNGLKLLIMPDQSVNTITVNITYNVGSFHEKYGETGMAHLLEHLLFKGSTKHLHITKALKEKCSDYNGTTFYDRTNYYETFPANEENLHWALSLEADRMVNSFVAKKDLDSEMTVVRNEFEMGENSSQSVLFERMMSMAFFWHNYGKCTIGCVSDVENVAIENLQNFYRKYYQPDNATLIVSGAIDKNSTLALVQNYFAPIPRPKRILEKSYTLEPTQDGARTVVLKRVGGSPQILAGYHMPAAAHKDARAIEIGMEILGDSHTGRLVKKFVKGGPFASISAGTLELRGPSVAMVEGKLNDGVNYKDVLDEFIGAIEHSVQTPFTQKEVSVAKKSLLKVYEKISENSNKLAIKLTEYIALGDWKLYFYFKDILQNITVEEVQKAMEHYFIESNRVVGIFEPISPDSNFKRSRIPTNPDLEELLKDFNGTEMEQVGEFFDVNIDSIAKRIHTIRVDNWGYSYLSKKTRNQKVVARIILHFGNTKALENLGTHNSFLAQMLMRDTMTKSIDEIKSILDDLKSSISISGNINQTLITINSRRENLHQVLLLLQEMLQSPKLNQDDFELLRNENIVAIKQSLDDPQTISVNRLEGAIDPYMAVADLGHPYRHLDSSEELDFYNNITLEEIRKFYENFYGGNKGEMSIVGDFDQEAIHALNVRIFNGWANTISGKSIPYERIPLIPVLNKNLDELIMAKDKKSAFLYAKMPVLINQQDKDYPALLVANVILGGGGLSSRLADTIRVALGLSYSVGSQISILPIDIAGHWSFYANYAPENDSKLIESFQQVTKEFALKGITQEELDITKTTILNQKVMARGVDLSIALILTSDLFLGKTFDAQAEIEKKINQLTLKDVNDAIKTHFDLSKINIVRVVSN